MPAIDDSQNPAANNSKLNLIQIFNSVAFILKSITGEASWKNPASISIAELALRQATPGTKGDKGDTGAQGIQGLKGDTGAQGIQGLKGDTGDSTLIHPGYVSGKYYPSCIYPSNVGTNLNTGFVYYTYFYIPFQQNFNRVGFISNTSFSNAVSARFAIYKVASGFPSTLVSDLGEISFTSNGFKEISCSLSLSSGWYAIALMFNSTINVSYPNIVLANLLGVANPASGAINGFRGTLTYGAFPSSPSLTLVETANAPLIWLRAA